MAAVDENGLEMGRRFGRAHHLHGGEVGDADHADVAVAPRLLRDPFHQVVDVLALAVAAEIVVADELALGAATAAHVGDNVAVAVADHGADVAGFDPAVGRANPTYKAVRSRRGFGGGDGFDRETIFLSTRIGGPPPVPLLVPAVIPP
jgi:hypothetical protein